MGNHRSVDAPGMLLTAVTPVMAGCSGNPSHPAEESSPPAPVVAPTALLSYAASDADHPAIQAWAQQQSGSQRNAIRNARDVQQTNWLFRRDDARPITVVQQYRGVCVARYIAGEASLLPPPTVFVNAGSGTSFGQRSFPTVGQTFIHTVGPTAFQ